MKNFIAGAIPAALVVVAIVSLYLWLSADAAVSLQERLPGADNRPANALGGSDALKIAGTPAESGGGPADPRGPGRMPPAGRQS